MCTSTYQRDAFTHNNTYPHTFSCRSGNPLPGTIVDAVVTRPRFADFFLLSHGGLQGTSRPTYYFIVHDDARFVPPPVPLMRHSHSASRGVCHTPVMSRYPRSPLVWASSAAWLGMSCAVEVVTVLLRLDDAGWR